MAPSLHHRRAGRGGGWGDEPAALEAAQRGRLVVFGGGGVMDILMVVARQNFRDEEFIDPRTVLEAAGHRVIIASTEQGPCVGTGGTYVFATLALDEVRSERFDGAVFVGGPGARTLFDHPQAHRIAVELSRAGRLVGAICIAPVILARAGILVGRKAAVFPGEREAMLARHAMPVQQDVVVDGKVVTASGPRYATAFGEALVTVLALQRARPARQESLRM